MGVAHVKLILRKFVPTWGAQLDLSCIRALFDQQWPMLTRVRRNRGRFRPHLGDVDHIRADVGQNGAKSGQIWPMPTKLGQTLA